MNVKQIRRTLVYRMIADAPIKLPGYTLVSADAEAHVLRGELFGITYTVKLVYDLTGGTVTRESDWLIENFDEIPELEAFLATFLAYVRKEASGH